MAYVSVSFRVSEVFCIKIHVEVFKIMNSSVTVCEVQEVLFGILEFKAETATFHSLHATRNLNLTIMKK